MPIVPPKELIRRLIPAEGVIVTGGQSTAGKTFVQIRKAICLASGQPYFDREIVERVGSVVVAAEGRGSFPNRVAAGRRHAGITEKMPVAWFRQLPDFNSVEGIKLLIRQLKEADKKFRGDFGVRLGYVPIDTVAACFNMRDENSNAEATRISNVARRIGEEVGAAIGLTHHYGKTSTSGLRGASAWTGSADVIEGVLADIDQNTGETTNRELTCTKARDGEQGRISAFELMFVQLGMDDRGEQWGSMAVVPTAPRAATPGEKSKKLSRGDRALRDSIDELMDGKSETITPRAGMAPVRAVNVTDLWSEFEKRYVVHNADPDPRKKYKAKHEAFRRALDCLTPMKFSSGDYRGEDWLWKTSE
jgi:hypothetical protein